MRLLVIIFIFLFSLVANVGASKLIPSIDIFASSNYHSFKVSPDGELVVGQMNLDEFNSLIVFRLEDLKAIEVFAIPDLGNNINGFDWVDEDSIYVSFDLKGENRPLRILNLKDTKNEIDVDIFDIRLTGYIVDSLSKETDKILFARRHYDGDGYSLVKLDLALMDGKNRSEQRIYARSLYKDSLSKKFGQAFRFVVNNDKQLIFVHEFDDDSNTYYFLDSRTEEWVEILSVEKNSEEKSNSSEDEFSNLVFRPLAEFEPGKIVVLTNKNRDKSAVVVFNLDTKEFEDVLYESNNYDIQNANWNFETNRLKSVFYTEKGIRQTKYLESSQDSVVNLLKEKIKRESIYIIDSSLNKEHLIVFSRDSTHPGEYYYFNRKTEQLKFLQNAMPGLYEYSFAEGQYISDTNENKDLVEGFLYLPVDAKASSPLVVMPHGGPVGVQDVNDFNRGIQFLVNHGYAVLRVNFRGSAGYGKSFKDAGRGEWGKGIEKDIDLIVNKVINRPSIDRQRMCIYGESYGGYSALISVIQNTGKYQCAIAGFPVTDLPLVFSASNLKQSKKVKKAIESVVGDIDENYQDFINRSPVYHAESIDVPVMLYGGVDDNIATYEHTRRMSYLLEHFNKEVSTFTYNTGHGHRFWIGDRHQYLVVLEFLDKHLQMDRVLSKTDKQLLSDEYNFLGGMHRQGIYVEKDKSKAEYFYKRSARLGNSDAKKELRKMGIYEF